jgi:prepilin-type N-terminal cleavage/methylation domain-containing protein
MKRNGFTLVEIIIVLAIIVCGIWVISLILGDWQSIKVFYNRPVGELKVVEFFVIILLILFAFRF